ncbi:hypothetical protein SAMN05421504_110294 [Amycolatopsis xylanica]|uniref:Uncharacterized protein n=1 Tax=Amycolatopsis xylanica TaxID=589385 RepID=A0A1H3R6C3_9PSEU|nr:hypothetical protein [Amycolatopsis xylanica]SDZ21073.1 hypothetical protein SAMN05421504_110294 [Amycolatopsis xylanica]
MVRLDELLAAEDDAEEHQELSPHERVTCRLHRRWAHQCIASPSHVIAVTGHRWCRGCGCAVGVAVDEFARSVALTCPRCRRAPDTVASRQIIHACRTSMGLARLSTVESGGPAWTS